MCEKLIFFNGNEKDRERECVCGYLFCVVVRDMVVC